MITYDLTKIAIYNLDVMLSRIYRSELEIRKHQIDTLKVFNDKYVCVLSN